MWIWRIIGVFAPYRDTFRMAFRALSFVGIPIAKGSSVEFVGGSLVTVGFLSSPACAALLIDMIVATLTSAVATLPKGLSPLSWLDDFLYLPEVLYVLFFIWLICAGPGKFSVDYWLAGKLLTGL
jgi:putative oxidoreductase